MEPGQAQAPVQNQPEAPLSNDQRIAAFANDFLNDLDQNTDPDQIEEVQEERPEVPQEQVEEEAEAQPQVELADVEYEGKQYQVPPELREALLRQSDYTRKTMELAHSRKSVEAMQQSVQQAAQVAQQLAPLHAQLFAMQTQAQALRSQLTTELLTSDPIGYNTIQGQLGLLHQDIQQFSGHVQQAKSHYDQQIKAVRQQRLQEGLPNLKKLVPDIDKPEVQAALSRYAVDKGLPLEALEYVSFEPVAVELIWKAQQYEQLIADQAKAKKHVAEKVNGLPAVKPTGRSQEKSAQTKQLNDNWRKGGGKLDDPHFDALLRQRLNRS